MSTSGPKDCRFDVSGVGIERLGVEDADARRDRFVGLALERLEKGLKDHLSAVAGNGHADLLANGLLGASEDEVVGEGLQTCTLAIGKRTGLLPMIDVSAAATGARDRVGGLRGVELAVDLRETGALDVEAQLAESSTRIKGAIELSEQTVALPEVAGWLADGDRIEPLDPEHQEAWQQRYGRYDKTRASRTLSAARAVNGLAACVQAAFIQGHAANPFGFDVAAFISSEAKRWGCPEAEISSVIDPLLPSVPSIEDDIVRQASVSGGKEWLLLEKAMTSVMIRLGFDESEHIGQKKAPRDGGYPDIRIKASTMQTCGFADTKATSRYGMDTNDTNIALPLLQGLLGGIPRPGALELLHVHRRRFRRQGRRIRSEYAGAMHTKVRPPRLRDHRQCHASARAHEQQARPRSPGPSLLSTRLLSQRRIHHSSFGIMKQKRPPEERTPRAAVCF